MVGKGVKNLGVGSMVLISSVVGFRVVGSLVGFCVGLLVLGCRVGLFVSTGEITDGFIVDGPIVGFASNFVGLKVGTSSLSSVGNGVASCSFKMNTKDVPSLSKVTSLTKSFVIDALYANKGMLCIEL